MEAAGAGFVLLVVAGVMNSAFALPMKFTRRWAWENTWAAWSLWALLLMPLGAALVTVPQLGQVYAQAGARSVLLVAACGAAWGIAQVLFGLAVDMAGIALAFAIVLGLSAAIGSLIPFVQLHADKVGTPAGLGVIAGVVLVVLGVSICARAGMLRDRGQSAQQVHGSVARGIFFALLSGIGAAAMNFGVAFGGPVVEAAGAHGTDVAWTMNAVWLPLMMAGAVPNLLYCLYLMRGKRTGENFRLSGTGHYWLLALLMAFLWFASTLMYGVASLKLGALGPVYGWPFFMSLIVIMASVIGVLAGEWKKAPRAALVLQFCGVAVLAAAVVLLSYAGRHL